MKSQAFACMVPLVATLMFAPVATSQPSTFIRKYDFSSFDNGSCVRQTPDGGFIVAGQSTISASAALIIRTNSNGDTLWTRSFPAIGGFASSLVVTDSGDYVVAVGSGFHIMKISPYGNVVWAKTHLPDGDGWASGLASTWDGGFIEVGAREIGGLPYIHVVKLNRDGDSVWAKTLAGPMGPTGCGVSTTADSGYVVVGSVAAGSHYYSAYLARLTAQGDTVWTKVITADEETEGYSVRQSVHGGFIMAGSLGTPMSGNGMDIFLVKTDENGNTEWTRSYGGHGEDYPSDIEQSAGGGYVISGTTAGGDSIPRAYLMRINAGGDTLWARQFREQDYSWATSVCQTSDSCFALAGTTQRRLPAFDSDILLIKTGPSGLVSVGREPVRPTGYDLSQNYPQPLQPRDNDFIFHSSIIIRHREGLRSPRPRGRNTCQ